MVRARWIGGRRFKQARHRPKPFTCCSMTAQDDPDKMFPSLRGGAGLESNKLLEILTRRLAEYEETKPAQAGNEQDLLMELKALVRKEPKNLLQELKHLVTKFTKLEATALPKQAVDRDWATVVRGKPKQQQRPSEWAPRRPAVNLSKQLPGKLRAEDWNAKIAEAPDQLEEILKKETSVVLAPFKNADVADMWAMVGAYPKVAATLVPPEPFLNKIF